MRDLICDKLFPEGDFPVPGELSWKGELIDLGEQVASFWPEKILQAQQWNSFRFSTSLIVFSGGAKAYGRANGHATLIVPWPEGSITCLVVTSRNAHCATAKLWAATAS